MPFELYIAIRYLREARFQTGLILAAVAVGVAVIVFLSALIDGLQANLISTTLGSQPHVIVTRTQAPPRPQATGDVLPLDLVEQPPARELVLHDWPQVVRDVKGIAGVEAVAALATGPATVSRGAAVKTVALRGSIPGDYDRIIQVTRRLRAGRFLVTGNQVLIGIELAKDLGLGVGEKFSLDAGGGHTITAAIAGIFDLGNKDVNRRWVLTSLRLAQSLLAMPGGVTSIEVRIQDVFAAETIADRVASRTGLQADGWIKLNKQLMTGLAAQSRSRDVIEFFVVVAVALGIASVLLVAVVQKSREIGIMRAFGASDRQMIRVFLIQGAILGSLGSVVGSLLGGLLGAVFGQSVRNPDGSPTFPIAVTPNLIASTSLIAIAVGIASAALPAIRATKLDPATVIRNG